MRPPGQPAVVALAGGLVPLLAAWNNVVLPAMPGYPGSYVPANLGATAVVLLAARGAGLGAADLGLDRRRVRAGLALGGTAGLVAATGYTAALAIPATRPLLADARLADLDTGDVVHDVLVRIPLGTVLWEEVAFRGVLLAALMRLTSTPRAVAASALLFGIWHVRPTADTLADNGVTGPTATLGVVGAVAFTTFAGVLFAALRLRSGSLLAPMLLHLATNDLGTLAGVAAHRVQAA